MNLQYILENITPRFIYNRNPNPGDSSTEDSNGEENDLDDPPFPFLSLRAELTNGLSSTTKKIVPAGTVK